MTHDERKKIYAALAAPFSEAAIERTSGATTGRGYDTTGIKYQYVVNRFNEVFGVGGYRVERTVKVREISTAKGRAAFDATCEVKITLGEWIDGRFLPFAEAIGDGGHTSTSEADAIKGSFTNGFKKCAAFFGVGKQAYEGTLDDDNVPAEIPKQPQAPSGNAEAAPASTGARPSASRPAPAPGQPGAIPAAPPRNRLTAKQLNALWAIAKGQGHDDKTFRASVVDQFGAQPEYLSRQQASQLISSMTANGHERQPGQDG